jgi:mannosylglycoprotein endo-beta-mannosidase
MLLGIVKHDIVNLFNDFHDSKADISRLNYGIITLLPKIKDASKIQQYRPICLLNFLYKLITKVLTIRIEPFAAKLIHVPQIAFMKGRNISSGIMCLHEIMHETKRKKRNWDTL